VTPRVQPEVEDEIRAAAQWYEDQAALGEAFLVAVSDALESIERHPRRFAKYERLRTPRELRRCLLRNFPYAIIYEVGESRILILAVAHVRRRPNYWRERLR
jgi:plasmid stabilization system protein ParE